MFDISVLFETKYRAELNTGLSRSPFDCLLACAQNENRDKSKWLQISIAHFFCISIDVKWNIKSLNVHATASRINFIQLVLQDKLYGRLMFDDFSSFSLVFLWNFSSISKNLEKCQFSIYQEHRRQNHKRHTQRTKPTDFRVHYCFMCDDDILLSKCKFSPRLI